MKYKLSIQQLKQLEESPYLTDRERKVFELFYKRGLRRVDIGKELYVSTYTVRNILANIRAKLTTIAL